MHQSTHRRALTLDKIIRFCEALYGIWLWRVGRLSFRAIFLLVFFFACCGPVTSFGVPIPNIRYRSLISMCRGVSPTFVFLHRRRLSPPNPLLFLLGQSWLTVRCKPSKTFSKSDLKGTLPRRLRRAHQLDEAVYCHEDGGSGTRIGYLRNFGSLSSYWLGFPRRDARYVRTAACGAGRWQSRGMCRYVRRHVSVLHVT